MTQIKQGIPKVCDDPVQFIYCSHILIKLSSEKTSYKMNVAVAFDTEKVNIKE